MTKRGHETSHFDAGRYSRIYVFSNLARWILVSGGLLLFAGCLFGTVYFGFVADMPRPGRIVAGGILAAFAVLGLYLAGSLIARAKRPVFLIIDEVQGIGEHGEGERIGALRTALTRHEKAVRALFTG